MYLLSRIDMLCCIISYSNYSGSLVWMVSLTLFLVFLGSMSDRNTGPWIITVSPYRSRSGELRISDFDIQASFLR